MRGTLSAVARVKVALTKHISIRPVLIDQDVDVFFLAPEHSEQEKVSFSSIGWSIDVMLQKHAMRIRGEHLMWLRYSLTIMLAVGINMACRGQEQNLPAFPGADGAAAYLTGGRGGTVYHVTRVDRNFSDRARGTLRYGLDDSNFPADEPRTIVFDVAGTFWLGRFGAERGHHNGWDSQSRLNLGSHITIAGQTSPGPVVIMGGVVKANGTNTILRNVTIAPGYGMRSFEKPDENPPVLPMHGDFPDSYVFDAIDISGQGIMIDHVTTVYATDETISVNEQADDVTIQYSTIAQAQNYPQADAEGGGSFTGHGLGSLIQPGSGANISVHNNLYAHIKGRMPRVGTERDDLTDPDVGGFNDFRNNLFYNWFGTAGQGAGGQPSQNNFVNNFYLAGPGGDDVGGGRIPEIVQRDGGTSIFSPSSLTQVFADGNVRDVNRDGDADDVSDATFGRRLQEAPFLETPFHGPTVSATDAYDRVLNYVGDRWWDRSEVDERLTNEVRSGTGRIMAWADDPFNDDPAEGVEWRNLLALRSNPRAAFEWPDDWDTDRDGMPNVWEARHNLPIDMANNNGDFDTDGYTDLEEYLNQIAAWPAPHPLEFTGETNRRYAQSENWHVTWQPSHRDRVVIREGTSAVVDAVGQHAGDVQILGSLSIEDGWLEVGRVTGEADGGVVIGDPENASPAELILSGGELVTRRLERQPNGRFDFVGGTLRVEEVDFDLTVNGGILSPGWDVGEATIRGDVQFSDQSILRIQLAETDNDRLVVEGDLVFDEGTTLAVVPTGKAIAETSVLIATYGGELHGEIDIVTDGYSIETSIPGEIRLLVPEPSSMSPMAVITLAIVSSQRRTRR